MQTLNPAKEYHSDIMANVNDKFFEGHYKEIWRTLIPPELTTREVDFMISYFNLESFPPSGGAVLDLMCGYGRHALALARKGVGVTAIDNLKEYTHELERVAKEEKLPVHVVHDSVNKLSVSDATFSLAICMGNSLQFFGEKDIIEILKKVKKALKPGGKLLINTWSLREIVSRNFKERIETQIGDYKMVAESNLENDPPRVEVYTRIITPTGEVEERRGIDYLFSLDDFERMFQAAGFSTEAVWSIPGRKLFAEGEPRAYIIAGGTQK